MIYLCIIKGCTFKTNNLSYVYPCNFIMLLIQMYMLVLKSPSTIVGQFVGTCFNVVSKIEMK
jgi:hypothetical protein